ncbi:MAG: hypothetical protein ACU0AT_13150 [Tranquillimonas sp.]
MLALLALLALMGIWLYAVGRPAEIEFEGIEATAGYLEHSHGADAFEADTPSNGKYRQLDLGRMVVRQEGPAAVTYWAIYFNVRVADPISPTGPEIHRIRDAVLDALVAVMVDVKMHDHSLPVRDVKQRVVDKLGNRFPNIEEITVREAQRSEVGRM